MGEQLPRLLAAWHLSSPRRVRPLTAGANNRTDLVETATGRYILRRYPASADRARIAFEHVVLTGLQTAGLSFAVPCPLRTVAGQTLASTAPNGGVAVLFPVIPGRSAVVIDPAIAAESGRALGELDQALARLGVGPSGARPPFGDLAQTHPLITDPLACVRTLPIPGDTRRRLQTLLEPLMAFQTTMYARIPLQVIHADFDPSNVLFTGARVAGVLDFEFAAPAPRVMDLAIGLHGFGGFPRDEVAYWDVVTAFAAGYRCQIPLTDADCLYLPDLMRLREATSLLHRVGGWRCGTTTAPEVAGRVDRLLRLDAVLTVIGPELSHRVATASVPPPRIHTSPRRP